MKKEKCNCREELMLPDDCPIYLHLVWCVEGYTVKEYDSLPWYRKLFEPNPRKWKY